MTPTHSFFLQILRDYLHQTETAVPDHVDWNELLQIAQHHKLTGIVYAQVQNQMLASAEGAAVYPQFLQVFGSTVQNSMNRVASYRRFSQAVDSLGLPYLPFKGLTIAEAYPEPLLRTMSDLDVIIRAEDREAIRSALCEIGFVVKQWSADEWKYSDHGLLYELQQYLLRPNEDENEARVAYFEELWERSSGREGTCERLLDPNFCFLYLIVHISKHFRGRGVGFRQFYDLAMLMHRFPDRFDWERIRTDAERIGLLRFTQSCLSLCETWFGVSAPLVKPPMRQELYETVTANIFDYGVFGLENSSSKVNELERVQRGADESLTRSKLKVGRTLLFPSYRHLSSLERYRYLRGRPWLLPYAWIARLVKTKNKQFKFNVVNSLFTASQKNVDEVHAQLDELGL